MLRISHERLTSLEVRLVAEGRLVGPWVGELEKSCAPFWGNGRKLTLGLSQVQFADREGVALLHNLARRGVQLECSPFLAELLKSSAVTDPGEGGPPADSR
jgi:hypothetical protein